jgi:hypothetical protein
MTARCNVYDCLQPTDITAKVADFADFQGPPAATAYWQQAKGPYANDKYWPVECRGGVYMLGDNEVTAGSSICEELYHPMIAIPTIIRELQPAWKSCTAGWRGGDWIWDPPMAMTATPSILSASVTIKPKGDSKVEETAATPGGAFPAPYTPPTQTPRFDPSSRLIDTAPIIIFTAAAATFTATTVADGSYVIAGAHTFGTGGLELTTQGATITIGTDGVIKVIQPYRSEAGSHGQARTATLSLESIINAIRSQQTEKGLFGKSGTITIGPENIIDVIRPHPKPTSPSHGENLDFAHSLSSEETPTPQPSQFYQDPATEHKSKKSGVVVLSGLMVSYFSVGVLVAFVVAL